MRRLASTLSGVGSVLISSTENTEGTKSRFSLLCFPCFPWTKLTSDFNRRHCFGAVWLSLLVLLFADACVAAPLKAELRPLVMQPRTGAPEWIDVRLTSSSTSLLEGVLELTALDDGSPSFVYRTQELALTTGTRAFRLLLPTAALTSYTLDRDVQARFLVKGGTIWDLGKFPLHQRMRMERSLVLAFGRTGSHADDASARLWQSLRLERFTPEKSATTPYGLITTPVMLEADDFPADPLVYCAFDAVLFESAAFAALKERPREALAQWLAGGGSACVYATGPLDSAHIELLRQWLGSDPAATVPEFDAEGRAQVTGDGLILARIGLGRLVVVTRPPEDFDTPAWRRATVFLWKVSSDQADAVERDGHWGKLESGAQQNWQNIPGLYGQNELARELTETLLPKTIRVIPLPVILALLIGFIVTVGPLDYFVLGKLRARKFTWVLFPLVSIGFTLLTMKLAEHYLGTDTHRGAFILTDLGADGRALRETRCELVLPAKPQEFMRDTQRAFAAPLGVQTNNSGERLRSTVFEGQYPARYTLRFPLAQWTPQMVRVSSLGGAADESGVNWAACDPREVAQQKYADVARAMQGTSRCSFVFAKGGAAFIGIPGELSAEFLARLTFTSERGPLLALLSPGNSGSLDDLALIERGDIHRFAVIAMRREGTEIHAWRCIYSLP
jgi:hypothetical protein